MGRRTISFELDDSVVAWLDGNAKRLNMNRTAYLEFLFNESKPLMDAIGPWLDSLADQFIKDRLGGRGPNKG
jgi:hypothetical protein